MPIVTLKEAATLAGMQSRSTLYRWLREGQLGPYLLGEPGRWRIDTEPPGERPWREWVAGVLGPQGWRHSDPDPEPTPDPEPPTPDRLALDLQWWARWGRLALADEPPLGDDEFWGHVAAMVTGLMGRTYGAGELAELARNLDELREAVAAGARFDAASWDAESARLLLEDPEVMGGTCPHSREELQALAAGGRLPPDLQAQAEAALAAYAARDEAAA